MPGWRSCCIGEASRVSDRSPAGIALGGSAGTRWSHRQAAPDSRPGCRTPPHRESGAETAVVATVAPRRHRPPTRCRIRRLLGRPASECGAHARGGRGGRAFVLTSMKRPAVSTRDSMPPGLRIGSIHGGVPGGPISRGSVRLLFALIKDEPSEPVGAEVDSRGGGAIYAAALQRRPSQHSRSPAHRTCERSGPASSGPRRRVGHMLTGAGAPAAGRRG